MTEQNGFWTRARGPDPELIQIVKGRPKAVPPPTVNPDATPSLALPILLTCLGLPHVGLGVMLTQRKGK